MLKIKIKTSINLLDTKSSIRLKMGRSLYQLSTGKLHLYTLKIKLADWM